VSPEGVRSLEGLGLKAATVLVVLGLFWLFSRLHPEKERGMPQTLRSAIWRLEGVAITFLVTAVAWAEISAEMRSAGGQGDSHEIVPLVIVFVCTLAGSACFLALAFWIQKR
jgi:hypothetical protein